MFKTIVSVNNHIIKTKYINGVDDIEDAYEITAMLADNQPFDTNAYLFCTMP